MNRIVYAVACTHTLNHKHIHTKKSYFHINFHYVELIFFPCFLFMYVVLDSGVISFYIFFFRLLSASLSLSLFTFYFWSVYFIFYFLLVSLLFVFAKTPFKTLWEVSLQNFKIYRKSFWMLSDKKDVHRHTHIHTHTLYCFGVVAVKNKNSKDQ